MSWETIDWDALERMRQAFLTGTAATADYWQSDHDLAAYDATFAQRIGWKWDFVLRELQRRGWSPPAGALLDWGCGSGIATRKFLESFRSESMNPLHVWDRSGRAMDFALKRARECAPELSASACSTAPTSCRGTVLLSHLLTELSPAQIEALVAAVATADCILWVEPGTYEASLTLIAIRERLRDQFGIVAPCTHQGRCGILAPENERHWCHHFASPPPEVFTDSHWARFANFLGIDLRALPLSFLVLDKRPVPPLPAGTAHLIGRPRLYKGHALLLGCDANGVSEQRLSQRKFVKEFKAFKKGKHGSLLQWQCEGGEIQRLETL